MKAEPHQFSLRQSLCKTARLWCSRCQDDLAAEPCPGCINAAAEIVSSFLTDLERQGIVHANALPAAVRIAGCAA